MISEKAKRQLEFLIQTAYVAVIILLIYLSCTYLVDWLLPFLLALFMVGFLHPIIRRLQRLLHIRHEILSVLVMLLLYCLLGTLLFFGVMQLVFLLRDALGSLLTYYTQTIAPSISGLWEDLSFLFSRLPPQWRTQLAGIQEAALQSLQSFLVNISQKGLASLSGLTTKVPGFLIGLVFTILLSLFISAQYDNVMQFLKHQLPPRAKRVVADLKIIIIDTILKYIRALLTLTFITFIELTVGLLVLRADNALAVAAGIAVFDALPLFGTGALVIPWIIVEFLRGNYTFAMGLLILYVIITVVRNFIEPKVVGDKLGLNPIVSLVAIYLGYRLMGVLGMIVMPIVAQIVLALHKNGTITLFRDLPKPPDNKPPRPGGGAGTQPADQP